MSISHGHGEPDVTRIAGRYVVLERLGEGGMGRVDRVLDERTDREVALKRLTTTASHSAQLEAMFEREYQTLAELAHPRIIQVYDYGIDAHGRYYTMELLCGQQLLSKVPLPWKDVCVILRDVASALALLHSRRQLHRDVTAGNVHVAEDGRAKLMDFGSLTTMGVSLALVGTPPYVAPEAFHGQPLDARTDLYALGALAYQALTGRHAYPAHRMAQLRDLWRSPVAEPSRFVGDVPKALSRLVLSLLALDRLARPSTAAEVIERLTAIAGLAPDEQAALATSYLSTPKLVGREQELAHIRQALLRAVRGRGGGIALAGPAGIGRSRLLASFRLEAQILGVSALHASGTPGLPYGTVRQLLGGALEHRPELAQHPALRQGGSLCALMSYGAQTAVDAQRLTHSDEVGDAVSAFFGDMCRTGCVLITVDDFHCVDPESAVALVRLVREAKHKSMLIAAAFESATTEMATVQLLSQQVRCMRLLPLRADQARVLLGSLFGDEVPNLQLVTDWAYRVSKGSPGVLTELAQHLLDRGVARFHGGTWILPHDLTQLQLPSSIAEALALLIGRLSPVARTLASALSLSLENHPLSIRCYPLLFGDDCDELEVRRKAHRALDELLAHDLVRTDGGRARFANPAAREILTQNLQSVERAGLHARLVRAFGSAPEVEALVIAYHAAESGDEERALDLVLDYLRNGGDRRDDVNRDFALEAHCLERALKTARRLGRSRATTLPILVVLLGVAHRYDRSLARYFDDAVEESRFDVGLQHRPAVIAELGDLADAQQVIALCMQRQTEEREALPETKRGLTAVQAADALARSAHRMAAVCLETFDADVVVRLPDFIEPIAALSPAVFGVYELAQIIRNHVCGTPHEHWRLELTERWKHPVAGLPDGARIGTVRVCTHYNAWYRSEIGSVDGLWLALELQGAPAYETLAWDVRLGVHLYQGDVAGANAARERRDVALVQRRGSLRGHCSASFFHEVRAYALCGDLIALKQALPNVAQQARSLPAWKPIEHWSNAEYQRLLGGLGRARVELEQALSQALPGRHRLWGWMASCYIEVLLELGEVDAAVHFADRALQDCRQHEISFVFTLGVRSSAGLAKARVGAYEEAVTLADTALTELLADGGGGLPLARLLENRASIAHAMNDTEALDALLDRLRDLGKQLANPALTARCEAFARRVAGGRGSMRAVLPEERHKEAFSLLRGAAPEQVPEVALRLLLDEAGASAGLLFVWRSGSPECVAQRRLECSAELVDALTGFMQAEIEGAVNVTATVADLAELEAQCEREGELVQWVSRSGEACIFRPLRFAREEQEWISGVFVVVQEAQGLPACSEIEPIVGSALARLGHFEVLLAAG